MSLFKHFSNMFTVEMVASETFFKFIVPIDRFLVQMPLAVPPVSVVICRRGGVLIFEIPRIPELPERVRASEMM